MDILSTCPNCKKTEEWQFAVGIKPAPCGCGATRIPLASDKFLELAVLNQCPICGCPHIYRQKDFNRNIGVALIVVGVALAYWTYGISLVIVTLVDWALNRYVKEVGVCYRCQAQFRKSETIGALETFNLSLHDFYKSVLSGQNGSDSGSPHH